MAGPLRIHALALTASEAAATDYVPLDNAGFATTKKIYAADLVQSFVVTGNIAYVDPEFGDDDTGAVGYPTLAFETPEAAQAAAPSGTLIEVYPGSYALTSALGKDGVYWHFQAGCTVTRTNTGTGDLSIFNDGGTAMTFQVTGQATFVLAGTIAASSQQACFKLSHASSDITAECYKLYVNSASGLFAQPCGIYQTGGTIRLHCDTIEVTNLATQPYAIYWRNGPMRVTVRYILTAGVAVGSDVSSTPTGDAFVTAEEIKGTSTSAVVAAILVGSSGQSEAKTWITCPLITAVTLAVATSGGKTYIQSQKIAGCTSSLSDAHGVVEVNGGTVWMNTDKVTGTFESGILVAGGTAKVSTMQIEDLGTMARALKVSSGTLELHQAQCVVATGDGIAHSGGTARLMGVRLDTSATAGKNPATVSGSGLILDHCTLVANAAADSVTAASGKTVKNYYSVANTAKNANITINDGAAIPLTVYSGVV